MPIKDNSDKGCVEEVTVTHYKECDGTEFCVTTTESIRVEADWVFAPLDEGGTINETGTLSSVVRLAPYIEKKKAFMVLGATFPVGTIFRPVSVRPDQTNLVYYIVKLVKTYKKGGTIVEFKRFDGNLPTTYDFKFLKKGDKVAKIGTVKNREK